ncbi:MAG TPA: tetratricopeptide repeat protein [Chitinophagaceae bacterium]|nr:tetratricopeptide repeat protein [Chitinophagales bacterium]HPG12964.1 tetratricopeptide repeat protein [Chitinophagaceae bacterium]
MNRSFFYMFILLLVAEYGFSQKNTSAIVKGNEFYRKAEYDKAVVEYEKVPANNAVFSMAQYNLANSLYKQGRNDEAIKVLSGLNETSLDKSLKGKIYYNKGAILSRQKKLEESIEAYKNALRQDPDDKEARENLQKSLLELKKKNQQQKKQENQNKKKQEQQKKQQSKLSPKQAEQRLQLLAQKEKEVQQRLQKQKSNSGGGQTKDW